MTNEDHPKIFAGERNLLGMKIGGTLNELKLIALNNKLTATAYLIDLAGFSLGWELGHGSLSATLQVKDRIKKDMALRNKL